MTAWLPDGFGDRAFIQIDLPERCQELSVGNTAEQHATVTDTEIHVSFSLFSWSIWAEMQSSVSQGSWPQRHTEGNCQNLSKMIHLLYSPLSRDLFTIFVALVQRKILAEILPFVHIWRWGTDPYWLGCLFDFIFLSWIWVCDHFQICVYNCSGSCSSYKHLEIFQMEAN